jgi:hypothetical protein
VDGQPRLDRRHVEGNARDVVVTAREAHRFARQRCEQHREVLVEALALLLRGDAMALEFVAQVSGADPQGESPAREHVDHRVVLRDRERIVDGEVRHRDASRMVRVSRASAARKTAGLGTEPHSWK